VRGRRVLHGPAVHEEPLPRLRRVGRFRGRDGSDSVIPRWANETGRASPRSLRRARHGTGPGCPGRPAGRGEASLPPEDDRDGRTREGERADRSGRSRGARRRCSSGTSGGPGRSRRGSRRRRGSLSSAGPAATGAAPASQTTSVPSPEASGDVTRTRRETDAMDGAPRPGSRASRSGRDPRPRRSSRCVPLEGETRVLRPHPRTVVGHLGPATPPPSTSTVIRVAPASSAFSTSSLTTDAGRSTTSPAAIWFTRASGERGCAARRGMITAGDEKSREASRPSRPCLPGPVGGVQFVEW